jgi:hypothetical protein
MRVRTLFSTLGSALILAGSVSTLPVFARASGVDPAVKKTASTEKKETSAPAPQPKQNQSKRVYTNDDFGWFHPSPTVAASQPAQAVSASPQASVVSPDGQAALVDPDQDPQWYAKQVASLQNELATVENKVDALQQFRATSEGLPTGLVLNAPTEGVSTDNLIAQLQSRQQQIEQQFDDLADLARVNGLPPGTVNQASAPTEPSLTRAEQQDALTAGYRDASDQLAENQAVLENMQQQAAAQGITLLPSVPGNGGNLTTNLLDGLNSQADSLQNTLTDAEDDARTLGVQPGDLR